MTLSESWIPLDIDVEEPAIPVRPGPGQNVVGMVATPRARERGWACRAAIEVCRGWSQDGSRILLCDVAFEDPELHEVAGLYNQEGVTDALLFGSSFRRLGQPLADGFLLATAGTAVPNPEALRSHPRWTDFAGGFTEAGAVLVLYLPSDAPGVEALYELCDTVVVLGERGEVDGLRLSSALGPLATFGPHPDAALPASALPPSAGAGEAAADVGSAAEEPVPVSAAGGMGAGVASGTERAADGAGSPEPGASDTDGSNAGSSGSQPPDAGADEVRRPAAVGSGDEGGGRSPLLWGVGALLLLAVVLSLTGVLRFPGAGSDSSPDPAGTVAAEGEAVDSPEEQSGSAGVVDTGTSAPLEAVAPTGPVGLDAAPVARFVLGVASYETLSAAFGDIVALRRAMPEAQFVISPVRVNDRVWFRMSAGSAQTAEEIVALRDRLAQGRPEAAEWLVREAGLSYLVDEYPSFAEADQRVALLAEQGIPGHILRYRDENGAARFRVYAGAYGSAAEARYLGEFLGGAAPALRGLSLVERRGFRPE